jgi:hypothetical protein
MMTILFGDGSPSKVRKEKENELSLGMPGLIPG